MQGSDIVEEGRFGKILGWVPLQGLGGEELMPLSVSHICKSGFGASTVDGKTGSLGLHQ